jgi:hypothetical protein
MRIVFPVTCNGISALPSLDTSVTVSSSEKWLVYLLGQATPTTCTTLGLPLLAQPFMLF